MPGPTLSPVRDEEVAAERGWKVLLYNDDVTPFELVILALQRAAGLSLEVAEAVAMEAHHQDVAVVKRGLEHQEAEIICGGLRRWTRVDGLCDGVGCEAVEDED